MYSPLQKNIILTTIIKYKGRKQWFIEYKSRYRKFASMGTFFLEKLMQILDIRITAESENHDDVD